MSICLVIATLAGGQDPAPNSLSCVKSGGVVNSIEQPFVEGRSVRLKLKSGDYTIRAGDPDRILVQWEPEKASVSHKMKKIKVKFDVSGSGMSIETDGPTDDARMLIDVPPRTHLRLRIFAGDVRVQGVLGDKDIKMTFGDLSIDAGPESYSLVHAAVKIGDLNARRFNISKDGFGRDFAWRGGGIHRLNARVFAGDLTLN
jgi:hypothetical protein